MSKKAILEAALFLSSEPRSTEELADAMDVGSIGIVSDLLEKLERELEEDDRGLQLVETNGKYEFKVKDEILERVAHFAPHQDLSGGVLRTLAVIAYNAPVEQKYIVEVRGNRAYNHIKTLLDRNFLTAEKKGRTKELDVTDDFLDYFGIDNVSAFREMVDEGDVGGQVEEIPLEDT